MSELIGRRVGPYEIKDQIGRGGMATVYRAYQSSLNRYVAIKVLPGWMAQDKQFIQRFRQEALAAGGLRHPNILRIYDAGTFENQHYIVMDYVPTGTLADRLHQGPLAPSVASDLTAQVADALDYVHRRGIAHRDIKPTNILIDEDGRPLLTDFGIAQAMGNAPRMTRTGTSVGTPEYMSPEQGRGERVDGRSDIYSLGIVLYQMLTGRVPFSATTPIATLYQVINAPPPPPRQFNANVPPYLESIVLRALAKRPEERFQRAGEMADALRKQRVVALPTGGASTEDPTQIAPVVGKRQVSHSKSSGRGQGVRMALIGVIGIVMLVAAAMGASALFNSRQRSTPMPIAGGMSPVPATVTATALPATATPPPKPTNTPSPVPPTATPAVLVIEKVVTATPRPTATPEPPTQTPVVVVITATPVPTTPPKPAVVVAKPNVNVRGGPGTNYPVIGQVSQGQELQVAGKTAAGDWWQIDYKGKAAWIANLVVQANPEASQVPVATHIPPPPVAPTPGQPGMILDFENFGTWKRGDQPYGTFVQTSERKHGGSFAGKLTYDFPAVEDNYVVFLHLPPIEVPGQPGTLSVWVYGDGSNHFLNAWIRDSQGEVRQFTFGQVSHANTWQMMTLSLDTTADWPQGHISGPDNGRLDYPISVDAIVFDAVPRADVTYSGSIYLDDLMVGGSQGTPSTTRPGTTPVASPAAPQASVPLAGHIVFASAQGGTTGITVVDVATKATWGLFSNARQPDIRGDGRVVFNGIGGGKNNLFTINVDGSGERMTGLHPEDSYPHWSPSGVSIVFYSTLQGDGKDRIYIQWDMSHTEEPKPLKVGAEDVFGRYPTWLETWRIAFTGCDYWSSGSHCGIWTINSDGSGVPAQLTKMPDDRSTDSARGTVLYASRATGNWEVYAIPGTGGTPRNLTNSPSQDFGATFSPDGTHVAFASDRGGSWGIWVMNANGGSPQKLISVPNGFGNNWMDERLAWGP